MILTLGIRGRVFIFIIHKITPQPYKCLVILHVIFAIILIHSTHTHARILIEFFIVKS